MLSDGVPNLCLSHCMNKQQFIAFQLPCWVPGSNVTPYPTQNVDIAVLFIKWKLLVYSMPQMRDFSWKIIFGIFYKYKKFLNLGSQR